MKINVTFALAALLAGFLFWAAFRAIRTGNTYLAGRGALRRVNRFDHDWKFWWAVSLQLLGGTILSLLVITYIFPSHFQFVVHALLYRPN